VVTREHIVMPECTAPAGATICSLHQICLIVTLSVASGTAAETGMPAGQSTANDQQAARRDPRPVELGRFRQLFIDDYWIDKKQSIRRNFHSADRHPANPIIHGDHPWLDGFAYLYGSVERHPDTGRLRLWYMSRFRKQDRFVWTMCLAESEDGISWIYPRLDLVPDRQGHRQNNMVMSTETHAGFDECLTPVRDPRPADPTRRYRSLFWANDNGFRGTYSAWSADGVKWFNDRQPLFRNTGDAGSIMYDVYRRRWVFFARPLDNQISRAVSFSRDFRKWSPLKVILQASKTRRENFYNMQGFCYEGLYLGTVTIQWEEPDRYALEPHLAISRDCENWTLASPQQALIPHGPRGSWEEFNTQMSAGNPIRMGDRLYFYYSGRTYPHSPYYWRGRDELVPTASVAPDVNIGLATLRVDGFASLEAHHGGGTVETRPFVFQGRQLCVNADAGHGELKVEILDHSGAPIEGFDAQRCVPIRTDRIEQIVRWNGDPPLQPLAGKPIRLKFHLNRARLYSFWIR